ncbi:protein shisa-9B [Stigmatopora nigra]
MRGVPLLLASVLAGVSAADVSNRSMTELPPLAEDKCRGYYDVMGQWDPPFVCHEGNFVYCCGTCGFRFCCDIRGSRLDQSNCKNYDTPPWMTTRRPPSKTDVAQDAGKDRTGVVVYVVCGLVAIVALVGVFVKLGLEKMRRPDGENVARTLAHVIRHPAPQHMDEMNLGLHYENLQSRIAIDSLHGSQLNNMAPTSPLLNDQYTLLDQISSPYEPQTSVKDLNKYATLKAIGLLSPDEIDQRINVAWPFSPPSEKANGRFYANEQRQAPGAPPTKCNLPMGCIETEPINPYSPARQTSSKNQNRRSHAPQSLYPGSISTPATPTQWQSDDVLGLRQCFGPTKLCLTQKELQNSRKLPPQTFLVTNSKTEVTV